MQSGGDQSFSIFNSWGHFIQWSRSVVCFDSLCPNQQFSVMSAGRTRSACAILERGIMGIICVNYFLISVSGADVLFLALVAILFSRQGQSVQFW